MYLFDGRALVRITVFDYHKQYTLSWILFVDSI